MCGGSIAGASFVSGFHFSICQAPCLSPVRQFAIKLIAERRRVKGGATWAHTRSKRRASVAIRLIAAEAQEGTVVVSPLGRLRLGYINTDSNNGSENMLHVKQHRDGSAGDEDSRRVEGVSCQWALTSLGLEIGVDLLLLQHSGTTPSALKGTLHSTHHPTPPPSYTSFRLL